MVIIIFSKNRAMQLDLLLRSLQLHCLVPHRVFVAWASSPGIHSEAAAVLRQEHSQATFIDDAMYGGPDRTVEMLMEEQYADKTMFLVDDAVLRSPIYPGDRPFELLESHPAIENISLRLCGDINYCYALNSPQQAPQGIESGMFEWAKAGRGDWSYPASIDGSIWLSSWLDERLKGIAWSNPNELEAALANASRNAKPFMALYPDKAPLFTVPHNRVQNQFQNRHAGGCADELCRQYLEGKRIDIEPLKHLRNTSVHVDLDYKIQ